ncbi:MAG TPA: hypothetical protein VGQ69_15805 [Gemmatimonadales bacterium]|jgi:hypothetical protein|nr:hypothetical protein [Gemmatimonadales bacterium]
MALPARNHRISLDAGAAITRRYREGAGPNPMKAGAFHATQVRELLDQPGCVALRIYYGRQDNGDPAFVLVGIDANDKELTGGIMLEVCFLCPPFCGDGSALNG